ncbi:hypothetical protein AST12_12210 [Staphylococcus succinus]|nr:hypothetical protein AST12_12210 [Staphylococcus succinus]
MKILAATQFKLGIYLKLLGIIGIFYLVFTLVAPGLISYSDNKSFGVSSPEILFSFYSGLAIFLISTTGMLFLFQNSASRKSMFLSTIYTMLLGNIICLFISQAIKWLIMLLPGINITGDLYQYYGHYFASSLLNHTFYFIFIFTLSLFFSSLGILFGTLFSLISKTTKMILLAGVGFITLFIISILNKFDVNIIDKSKFILGANTDNTFSHFTPINPIVFGFIISLILITIYYIVNNRIQTNNIVSNK